METLDAAYFETLYRSTWHKLYRYCLSYIHDQTIAEEILQSIFESLWSRREEMTIKASTMENYLFRAVKLKIFDYHRKEASRMKHEASIGINTPNSHNDTEDTYLFHELSAHVASLVDQLPGRCQQVYKLNIEEGFSYREVAEEMDISVHTVKEHLTRARNFLTSNLRKQYRETLQL